MSEGLAPAYSGFFELDSSDSDLDNREDIRLRLARPALLLDSSGLKAPCSMSDLSQSGCQLTYPAGTPIRVGRVYCVKLEGMESLGAYAIWASEKAGGFLFVSRLHRAVVEHIANAFPSEISASGLAPMTSPLRDPVYARV